MITVLCGGTGAAKFLQGLQQVIAPREITAIVNTGDDLTWWGLHVSPDVDSVTYGLAGVLSKARGWGVDGDTFECLARMRALGQPAWFSLGDRDLATHLYRTHRLAQGATLTEVTQELAERLGVAARILPMTNDRVETRVTTAAGDLSFQEYFVRERHSVVVTDVSVAGAEKAQPAPGVLQAIASAEAIIIAPSNPITSIGPILAVPGILDALRSTNARIAAISPIIGGDAVSGPAADLMRMRGLAVSGVGIAQAYRDFLDVLVADQQDAAQRADIAALGVRAHFCDTMMTSDEKKAALASAVLEAVHHEDAKARRRID